MSKFLIVDNSKVILKMISTALEGQTINGKVIQPSDVVTANDGLEAFGLLGKHKDIDYIITEIDTPGLGGDDLIELLLDTGKIKEMGIIFICEECNLSILKKDYTKNILGSIKKPFSKEAFFENLSKIIAQKQEWKTHLEKLKPVWEKQKKFVTDILNEYVAKTEQGHRIDQPLLYQVLENYIQTEEITPLEELRYTIPIIAYEYAESAGVDFLFNTDILSCIFDKFLFFETVHDTSILLPTAKNALKRMMEKSLEDSMTVEQLISFVFKDATTKLKEELEAVKSFGQLDYKGFKPFLVKAMSFLERIDCKIHSPQIMESEHKIKLALQEYESIDESLYFPNDAPFLKQYRQKDAFAKEFTAQRQKIKTALYSLLSYHLGRVEKLLWQEAKRSKEIYEYFKKLPRYNTLSSYSMINLLISKNMIAAGEVDHYRKLAKYFEKSESKEILLFSKDYTLANTIETTNHATSKKWKYQAFTSLEPMMKHFEKNLPDLLFFDYDMFKEVKKETFIKAASQSDNFKKLIVKGGIILLASNESDPVVALARQLKVGKMLKKPMSESKYIELVNRT